MSQLEDADSGRTALDAEEENSLAAVSDQDFIKGLADWNGPDYAAIRIPSEANRPKWEWDHEERQAYFFDLLRRCGTPSNLPKSQGEFGDDFGVTQQQISKDIDRVRKYIAAHAGQDAISKAEMLAHRATDDLVEDDPKDAMDAWLKYCEFLFELGAIDRAPEKKQVATFNRNESLTRDLDEDEEDAFDQMAEMMTGNAQDVTVEDVSDDE